ncbi:nicotinate-nucleotide adenylyltransferase [Maricaulis parjimensis]|uniref:nicotinate-nucleotide adenylyltransferase n=1 Tax=Maricaulis parjimensis TaxID=144023 RepID=UPI003B83231B
MRVGLLGGTFDPPHAGHLHAARTAMRRLQLDRVWWLVSPQNPLKPRRASDLERRMSLVADLAREPGMVVSDIEARIGTTRTIDLLHHFKTHKPGVKFVWLMGADNLASIHRWAHWQGVFAAYPVAVIARPTDAVRARLSPAARYFAHSRIPESEAAILPELEAPAWTYLTARLHPHASSDIRRTQRQSR